MFLHSFNQTLNLLNKFIPIKYCSLCRLPDLNIICKHCLDELETLPFKNLCQTCKKIVASSQNKCNECQNGETYFDNLYCKYIYTKPLTYLVHQLKYQNFKKYAPILGYLLNQELNKLTADLIIPIPLHKKRYKERGFNQVELILKPYSKLKNSIPIKLKIVKRINNTMHQTQVAKADRKNNLDTAFELLDNVQGLHILLVDDVVTTKSTVNAVAKLLKQSGALSVDVVCLLRTL